MKIEKANYSMMRGMEAVHKRTTDSFVFLYHKPVDLTYFFIDIRYVKDFPLPRMMGWVGVFYWPIVSPEYQGVYYYLFPIAWWIHTKRWMWKMWTYPLRVLVGAGWAEKKDRGAMLRLLWWRDVRWGRKVSEDQ